MKQSEALAALGRIRELIDCFGGDYSADRQEFMRIIETLRSGPIQDAYFKEKISDLERQADTGFSQRKFMKYTGGLSQVKVWALGSLAVATDLVEEHWVDR